MPKAGIPPDVRRDVEEAVARFNRDTLGSSRGPVPEFIPRFRGQFVYLDRQFGPSLGPVCRLRYTGSPTEWEFAIYKYSSDRYDPDEWWFPGTEFVDGTVEGALRAGMEAYPV